MPAIYFTRSYDVQLDQWSVSDPFLAESHPNGKYFRYTHSVKTFAYNDQILAFGGCWARKFKPLSAGVVKQEDNAEENKTNCSDRDDGHDDDDDNDVDLDMPCRAIASFDFESNKWVPWNDLVFAKMQVMPVLSPNGELFVGGYNHQMVDQTETITFERYDAVTKKWTLVCWINRFDSVSVISIFDPNFTLRFCKF